MSFEAIQWTQPFERRKFAFVEKFNLLMQRQVWVDEKREMWRAVARSEDGRSFLVMDNEIIFGMRLV